MITTKKMAMKYTQKAIKCSLQKKKKSTEQKRISNARNKGQKSYTIYRNQIAK